MTMQFPFDPYNIIRVKPLTFYYYPGNIIKDMKEVSNESIKPKNLYCF